MKIVITRVGDCLIADGLNLFIYELSDALLRLGHEVYLMSGTAEYVDVQGKEWAFRNAIKEMFSVKEVPSLASLSYHGLHTWRTPFLSLIEENLLFAYKGSRIISQISPDMVVFNGVTTMLCPCFKVAVCTDMQFRVKTLMYYDSLMYRTSDKIVAVSTELKHGLTRQFRLPAEKIPVIPVCIDVSKFRARASNNRIHAILHVGTRPEKGPDTTVDAFEIIARNDPELELLIAGGLDPRAGPLLSRIRQKDEKIQKRISFLGNLSKEELVEVYSKVKVTCVPSDYTVPVCSPTVIESLASGTPVVGSLSAISEDILIEGYTGFRVKPGDIAMYASRLKRIITNDELRSEMSRNAVNVAQRFDKMKVARDYLSLYKSYSD